jgi:tetratricopeptide (TPR) repeat protein
MRKTLITLLFLFIGASFAFAQADEVNKNLRLFAHGRIDEVKNNIPNLIAEYPNDPGVKLLLGVVLDDAGKALKLYEEIINDHQKSQWADDAYWRIVQYYAVLGDTAKARFELEQLTLSARQLEWQNPARHRRWNSQSLLLLMMMK